MSWSDYVNQFLVTYINQNTGNKTTNVCEHGAIVGLDRTLQASTSGFSLDTYSLTIENGDGTSSTVQIDEFANLNDAFQNRGTTSRPGGIRLHREKYYIVFYDPERNVMYLRKRNGGACVVKSNTAYIVGTFSSALMLTEIICERQRKTPQNPGAINQACEALQTVLLENNL